MQVFPSRKPLIRFVGAVLAEMDEQWSERRWFSQDPMDEILEKAKPAPSPEYEIAAAEHGCWQPAHQHSAHYPMEDMPL